MRVKQRTTGVELVREDEKQLETLKRQIVGMLLAWHSPVSVTLKSAEGSKNLHIRGHCILEARHHVDLQCFQSSWLR